MLHQFSPAPHDINALTNLNRNKPKSLISDFQVPVIHRLHTPRPLCPSVPARTPPSSHPLPQRPPCFCCGYPAELSTHQHHPAVDNTISHPLYDTALTQHAKKGQSPPRALPERWQSGRGERLKGRGYLKQGFCAHTHAFPPVHLHHQL